jgi:DHA1 family multidrug resistance protein-like MFS transporter
VQGGLMGKLTSRFGEGPVIQGGIIVSAIGFALILLVKDFLTAAIFLTIFGIGNGVIRPSISSLLTKVSTVGHGSATGLLSSFDSIGRIVGPPLGGWLFSLSISLPYISGAIMSLIALVLYRVYTFKSMKTASKI